jgi:hypothetical protein
MLSSVPAFADPPQSTAKGQLENIAGGQRRELLRSDECSSKRQPIKIAPKTHPKSLTVSGRELDTFIFRDR